MNPAKANAQPREVANPDRVPATRLNSLANAPADACRILGLRLVALRMQATNGLEMLEDKVTLPSMISLRITLGSREE